MRETAGAPGTYPREVQRLIMRLRVNPIQCVAHGLCGELLPEAIRLDEWGYPIIDGEVTPELLEHARRAAGACPTMALLLETDER
jgi:ferredoxin